MKEKRLFNALQGFDFNLLKDPEFKEDSVREEIIVPIIKNLGYSAGKPYQIIRSRKLLHPYVSIGSQKKDIYIIPDYLFEVDGRPAWILDAKSPTEDIIKSHHVEQAYSYAIHSEVRVEYFALCNGLEFVLYNTQRIEPIMHFPMQSLPVYWESLLKFLSPSNVFNGNHFKLAKDFGLHLKRLGFDKIPSLIIPKFPIVQIGQIDPCNYSMSGGLKQEEGNYVVTFDFDDDVLNQMVGKIPQKAIDKLKVRNSRFRQVVQFGDAAYLVNIDCRVGSDLQENNDEIFLPLTINRIL